MKIKKKINNKPFFMPIFSKANTYIWYDNTMPITYEGLKKCYSHHKYISKEPTIFE
jgi:hypothetical protein